MRAALTTDWTLWRTFTGFALGLALACAALGAHAASLPSIELEIKLDPDTRAFSAQARIRQQTTDFSFALHEALEISAASSDGKPLQVMAAWHEGSLRGWRLVLPMPGVIELRYGGTLPVLDTALDHREVLRRLAPMAGPEGSFLPADSAWYPLPGTLFTYRVAVSVPGTQRALVAGRLESETLHEDANARYRASFEFTQPTDGIDLMAGPWQIREQLVTRSDDSPLRLRTYFPAELDAIDGLATAYLDDSRRYIERYSQAIGPYPYAAFSVVASPLPTGLGMPTLTYIGAEVLKLPFIRATSLGHEVLHNWWGNGVFVDYATGNWAEGLTTFMADYAYKEDESASAARDMRLGWLRDFAAVPDADQRPLAAFRSRTHGAAAAVGYGKSAMLFVMLRDQIGADAFDRGIRDFWQKNRFGVAGWQDLRAAFETASGRDLSAFFAQWLERSGGPTVSIEQARAHIQGATTRLIVDVTQSAPPYALTVPVELVFAERSETRELDVHQASAQLTLDLAASPDSVRVDPDLRLWRVLAPDQLPPILRQWVTARAPRLVVADTAGDAGTVQVGTTGSAGPFGAAANTLAAHFFERPPRPIDLATLAESDDPVLLIGTHDAVDAALASAGLPLRPDSLGMRGSAQVWTVMGAGSMPVAVVSARDAAAVEALLRPLPHYGAQSWLVFDGSRALERGIWAAPGAGVTVRSD